ncbi:mucin-like protein, partial [Oculina patagonica]
CVITDQEGRTLKATKGQAVDKAKDTTTNPPDITTASLDTTIGPAGTTTSPPGTTTGPPGTTTAPPDTTTGPPDTTTGLPDTTPGPPGTTTGPPDTTTGPPDTTTGPPGTTTGPPATSTGPPDTTTDPSGTTTGPPDTTTGPPGTTTGPPDTTTGPPATSTGPPDPTTGPPATTTGPPDTTTSPSDTTTGPPGTTTGPPDTTTAPPDTTTAPPDTTTAPPDTTTAPPDTTTAPPDTTTAPPDTTTAPPDTTTAPPDITTAPPDTTTSPPDTTTGPPGTTTGPPDTTTAPPDTTTAPPDITTAPPDTTTSPPDTTTAPPDITTAPPDITTAPPDTTTAPPDTTTAPPDITTAPPDTTTSPPDTTTGPPGTTTGPPDTTTAPPDTTTAPPDTTTAPPDTTTAPPDTTTAPPDTTTAPPDITTAPPDTTTSPPDTTTGPPDTTTALPATTTGPSDTTTAPPATTTGPPDTTTDPPGTTTAPPDTTTGPPDTTTALPATTTGPPDTTTAPPATTTGPSDTTTGPPDTTTAPPDTTTGPPDTTTGPTDTTTSQPDTTTGPPDTTTGPPGTTTGPPDTTTGPPDTTTGPSVTTTGSPDTTTEPPPTTTVAPTTTTGPTTTTAPATTTTGPTTTAVPAGLSFFEQDCLDSHNNFRSLHSAFTPMTWNRDIANGARTWAQFLLQNQSLLHEVAVLNSQNLGENLGRVFTSPAQPICSNASETSCVNCSQVVTEWYNEISNYNFDTGTAINSSLPWLHFTQIVWRSSTELGVGVASGGGHHYVVARYKPRGNVDGTFDRNVPRLLPPTTPPTTTGPPDTTTGPPDTTTGPPNTTTGPPDTTTAPPNTTTGPPDTTTGTTTGPPDTTTAPPNTTTGTTTGSPDTTTGPPDTTTGPPDTTTAPPTTPPFCLANRQPVTQEEVANSVSLVIPNLSIPEWCDREGNFTEVLAVSVANFCNTTGSCPTEPTSSDVEVVILPGFPRVNSPLELRFLIRLRTAMNASVTLPKEELNTALESFLRNISDTFGIEFTVDGNFTEWGPWGPCSAPCAGGTQMRFRNCTNPPPINNGSDCQGPRNETQQCNVQPCPACVPPGAFLTGTSGVFSSPNFPNNFLANSNCTWNITVPSGLIIKVSFFNFTLEPNQNTACIGEQPGARVSITNVASDNGREDFQLCGQNLPSPVYSEGNSIQVRLASLSNVYSGFNASYEAIDGAELCPNTTLNETTGVISTPFYPRLYPDNQACQWTLTAEPGKRIRLVTGFFNIQQCGPPGACTCDFFEVQNAIADRNTSERICGAQDSITFVSITESMTVLFVSDSTRTKQYDGFMATYSQFSIPTTPPFTTPAPTTPPSCLRPRRNASQEEINNAITIIILNFTIPQWCAIEDDFKLQLATFVTDFCNAEIGRCANTSIPSDADLINILPGYPIQNSPLRLRFYVRLKAGRDQHVTIDIDVLQEIFAAFARNISDTFGVEFTADGNFTNWGPWGPCSASCAPGGIQMRFRNCTNPPPINNGSDCQGPRNETQQCNVQPCPVDGNFTQWGLWTPCSQTCGNGTQLRFRNCTNPPPQHGGKDCVGPRNETQECFVEACPVDGNFTEWGAWGACSQTCGNGTQIRLRNCTNPPPAHGGRDCMGERNQTQECYTGGCPVDGNWTQWTAWGQCSVTCGNGTQTRYRSCINPPPSNGGRDCPGPRNETQPCEGIPCTPRMYAYGRLVGDTTMSRSNVYQYRCLRINIGGQGLPFFVRPHRRVYICRNGLLRFISYSILRFPERFPGARPGYFRFRRFYMQAPFWSYISHLPFRLSDSSRASKVFYQVYAKNFLGDVSSSHAREFFDRANSDVQRYQTNPRMPNFNATWGMKVTWVRLYPITYPLITAVNTFQIVLVTDGQHSFTLFNYPENGIEWASSTGPRSRVFSQRESSLPVIGYNAGDAAQLRFENVPGSGTVEADTVDERLGNTNRHGVWFFRSDISPVLDLPAKKCYTWFRQQAQVSVPQVQPSCPCTFNQAIADKRFFVDYNQRIAGRNNLTICAYSVPFTASRWAQQCCYTLRPGVGRVLTLGQTQGGTGYLIGVPGIPIITDLEAHGYCCNSSLCALYYQRRQSDDCDDYVPRRRGLIWGDPHFATLDNKLFTFNGLGEYTMVLIDDGTFELQARTKRTSGRGLGTVFSAAAAKHMNEPAVEGRLNSKDELEILVGGVKQNVSTITMAGMPVQGADITLIKDTDDSITALFPSGITVTFASISKTLAIAFDGPDQFKNRTRGLLGTWNDDPSDDFTLPDGTVLPSDASPQQIHYEFGLKWQIDASETLFTYRAHESPLTFMELGYVPMFIDNITWTNDSFRQQAESVCGNNTNCLFDVAVTVDTSFGESTKRLEENNNQLNSKLACFPPHIEGPQVINATINETVEVIITASHNSSNAFVFSVKYFPDIEIVANNSQKLVIRWRPITIQKVEPVFIVTDRNNSASELRPQVRLCPCQNGGHCIDDDDVQRQLDGGVRFIVLSCACPSGLTGQFCESHFNACVENNDPCFPGVKCANVPLNVSKTGFTCGPCPSGYHGDGTSCFDIDECINHVTKCSQSCINTPGSYVCDCDQGFKLEIDGITCSDINECVDSNDCMQQCTNYPGGRNCSCNEGFQVDPMDSTACRPITRCNSSEVGCQQVCSEDHGQPMCSCYKGYQLIEDNKSCVDIDECTTHRHRCSQKCHNTEGGYTCSCDPGFELDPDQMTCTDIDECGLIDVIYCANTLELCINTLGSFHCECQEGYQYSNNACEEIVPATEGPTSTGEPTTSVKTDQVPEDAVKNAVVMTIRNVDLAEWSDNLSKLFKEVIAQVVENYCEQENCYDSKVNKRSISSGSMSASVHLLKHFPRKHHSDLVVAFYVILHLNKQDDYIMTQNALLRVLKQSAAEVSARIHKKVYNIRAYDVEEGTPPPRESQMDTSQPKWIVIGVSLAVIVVMVIVVVVLCRRRKRSSSQLGKHSRKSSEFILRQWGGTPEETVFLGITNQATKL